MVIRKGCVQDLNAVFHPVCQHVPAGFNNGTFLHINAGHTAAGTTCGNHQGQNTCSRSGIQYISRSVRSGPRTKQDTVGADFVCAFFLAEA